MKIGVLIYTCVAVTILGDTMKYQRLASVYRIIMNVIALVWPQPSVSQDGRFQVHPGAVEEAAVRCNVLSSRGAAGSTACALRSTGTQVMSYIRFVCTMVAANAQFLKDATCDKPVHRGVNQRKCSKPSVCC